MPHLGAVTKAHANAPLEVGRLLPPEDPLLCVAVSCAGCLNASACARVCGSGRAPETFARARGSGKPHVGLALGKLSSRSKVRIRSAAPPLGRRCIQFGGGGFVQPRLALRVSAWD